MTGPPAIAPSEGPAPDAEAAAAPLALHEHRGARELALTAATLAAFGAAVDGELVWDDAALVESARGLGSPLEAFSTDFFSLGGASAQGAGPAYWRPLITLSYYLEARIPAPLPFVLHACNLFWHALASVLVMRALLRWTAPKRRPSGAAGPAASAACLLGALLWATMPLKAENVAWISGRADVIGLALLLLGLELRRRFAGLAARAACVAGATALALLAKEALLVAPAIVAVDVALAGRPTSAGAQPGDEPTWSRVARAPEVITCALVVVLYFVIRAAVLPIQGGGAAMFAGLRFADRLWLFLETVGHAFHALALPWRALLLRGPVGFSAPFVLQRDAGMAAAGAAGVVALVILGWRSSRARPAVLLFAATLLPIANLIPTGLESKMSDRFLYVPSLAIALGAALALAALPGRAWRWGAAICAALVGFFVIAANQRSALFRGADALWAWEQAHGDRATSILINAGTTAARAGRLDEARDLRLEAADRYGQLGFAEGFPYVLDALRLQVEATGEAHSPSFKAYGRTLGALIEAREERIDAPFPDGKGVSLSTGAPEARAYAASRHADLAMRVLVLRARLGREQAGVAADEVIRGCADCRSVLVDAARVRLALLAPARAAEHLARLSPADPDRDPLEQAAALQARLLTIARASSGGPAELALAKAYFVGQAYGPACAAGAPALSGDGASSIRPGDRRVVGIACLLGGDARWTEIAASIGPEAERAERDAIAWRTQAERRHTLVRATLPREPALVPTLR